MKTLLIAFACVISSIAVNAQTSVNVNNTTGCSYYGYAVAIDGSGSTFTTYGTAIGPSTSFSISSFPSGGTPSFPWQFIGFVMNTNPTPAGKDGLQVGEPTYGFSTTDYLYGACGLATANWTGTGGGPGTAVVDVN